MKIKGVNLGNWLVLEKWMSPALFAGTTAEDEYYLPRQLPREVYEARILIHRSEYITERDFVAIKAMGMEAVRIPVPYFIFGDREPFIGCIQELDKAFNWAERYGLQILIDLHTAPMGQNGFDNGGICGVCKWSRNPEEVEFVLSVLERLAKRYGTRKGLWGIEVLNEPITERAWKMMNVPVPLLFDFNVVITNLNKMDKEKALELVAKLRNNIVASAKSNDEYAANYADIPLVGRTIFEQQRLLYHSLLEWLDTFESQYRGS